MARKTFNTGDILAFRPGLTEAQLRDESSVVGFVDDFALAFAQNKQVEVTRSYPDRDYFDGRVVGGGFGGGWSWSTSVFVLASEVVPAGGFKAGDRIVFRPGLTRAQFQHPGVVSDMERAFDRKAVLTVSEPVQEGRQENRLRARADGVDGATEPNRWWKPDLFVLAPAEAPAQPSKIAVLVGDDMGLAKMLVKIAKRLGFSFEGGGVGDASSVLRYIESDYECLTFEHAESGTRADGPAYVHTYMDAPDGYTLLSDLPSILAALAAFVPPAPAGEEPLPTKINGYTLSVQDNGDVTVGCTTVPAALVARLAAKSVEKTTPAA